MKNKRLEERIRKRGKYDVIIALIERCEKGVVVEVKLEKSEAITDNLIVDKMILTYLKKLNVKVSFTDNEGKAAAAPKLKSKNKIKTATCSHAIHTVVSSSMKKSPKKKAIKKNGWSMFKIDSTTFVACPKCFKIFDVK